jgi:hypothetical protein
MMSDSFTPGPWVRIPAEPEIDEDGNETGAFVYPGGIEGADGNPVCTFGDARGSATMFENPLNPDLISAAPCMFEALLIAAQYVKQFAECAPMDDGGSEAIDDLATIGAALSKARGENSLAQAEAV